MQTPRWITTGFFAVLLAWPLAAQQEAVNAQAAANQLPGPVADVLRNLTRGLAEQDGPRAQAAFAKEMPQYRRIIGHILSLAATEPASSTIEVIRQQGEAGRWKVELDWLFRAGTNPPRRAVVTVDFALVDGEWRIVGFDPIDWFQKP